MLRSSGKPFYMHWNLPTGSPKRRTITSAKCTPLALPLNMWMTNTASDRRWHGNATPGVNMKYGLLKVERFESEPGTSKGGSRGESEPGPRYLQIWDSLRLAVWRTRLWQTFCVTGGGWREVLWGLCGGRLSGPGGTAWRWHAGHSEGASMFSPYMMLHVLFFLDLLWEVKGDRTGPPKWFSLCRSLQ